MFLTSRPEIVAYLRTLKFRDWTFELVDPSVSMGNLVVEVSYDALDSDEAFHGIKQPSTTHPAMRVSLPWYEGMDVDTRRLDDFMWGTIRTMLIHEAGEWFTINGERPFYPHKPPPVGRGENPDPSFLRPAPRG